MRPEEQLFECSIGPEEALSAAYTMVSVSVWVNLLIYPCVYLCGCLSVCGAGCLADDVNGGVLILMSIDVLGGRYLEVVGSKMLYGLVIEAIVFAVLDWKLLFVGLEVGKWLQIEFVFLETSCV